MPPSREQSYSVSPWPAGSAPRKPHAAARAGLRASNDSVRVLTSSEGDDGLGDGLAAALNFPEVFVRIFWVGRNIRAAVTPCGQRVCNSRLRVLRVKFELCCPRDHIAMSRERLFNPGGYARSNFPVCTICGYSICTRAETSARRRTLSARVVARLANAMARATPSSPLRALRPAPDSAAKELRRMPAERNLAAHGSGAGAAEPESGIAAATAVDGSSRRGGRGIAILHIVRLHVLSCDRATG